MGLSRPTIRGIFVKSHINAVKTTLGENGLLELERRFGRSLAVKNLDEIPVEDESKIIEISVDLLTPRRHRTHYELAVEAGRLHFRNFKTTPLGRILLSVFPTDFGSILVKGSRVAEHIFRGMKFSATHQSPNEIVLTIENNGYPVGHFQGLFEEWLLDSGYRGFVDGQEKAPGECTYTIRWQNKMEKAA